MKRILLAGATLLALTAAQPTLAADAPVYKGPAPYAVALFNWSGCYIGVQAGGGWGRTTAQSGPFPGAIDQSYGYNWNGGLAGGHLGCNWQTPGSSLVFGVEGDIDWSGMSGAGVGTLGYGHITDIDWTGSVRGRIGMAADATLFYLTGGFAFGDVSLIKSIIPGGIPFATFRSTRTGWTVGGGVEHAFSQNLTARVEYRYTDLGSTSFSSVAANSQDVSSVTFHALRAGLTWKW